MFILICFFVAFTVVAFTMGRLYERQAVSYRRSTQAEEERVMRPWVTVTDGGPLDEVAIAVTREVLREEEPKGRHHIGVAIGTRTQRAGWNTPTHQFHALIGATWSPQERADLEAVTT